MSCMTAPTGSYFFEGAGRSDNPEAALMRTGITQTIHVASYWKFGIVGLSAPKSTTFSNESAESKLQDELKSSLYFVATSSAASPWIVRLRLVYNPQRPHRQRFPRKAPN
ncbi:hypothetical protein METBIDRAFT_12286 [Metschnikowia bicuspidata var. bicuspidata NRRL YB-4993]|uniref:Uncharacterized protein n=1 Tax=Metschnikowia bicuspidata var. bicuspidata NRRL YB-4993 TaxID=869754 RepID=A0A1A0H812_9ASCO|nr:hypothetical protein METBIDRAFT_12286 [Metschnikowia bicuspidata var. bicuspidata NRRL YB-4993]OBA20239.1 hypothetical protein METBIDRAFT_12286 [Metschnikowia bicuspidata var. bicuspidata NRRL YB-4993]